MTPDLRETENEVPIANWSAAAACTAGAKHRRAGTPCQDACAAGSEPFPYLIVCDGRGSSAESHLGSAAAVEALERALIGARGLFSRLLGGDDSTLTQILAPAAAELLYDTAAAVQKELSAIHELPAKSFEFTLLICVVGRARGFCLQVGDGALVIEDADGLRLLMTPQRGEFANITRFVQAASTCEQSDWALFATYGLRSLAGLTDGTADKMIECATGAPTPGFRQMWSMLRGAELSSTDIETFLARPDWEPTVQDDRSLALLVCTTGQEPTPTADCATAPAVTPIAATDDMLECRAEQTENVAVEQTEIASQERLHEPGLQQGTLSFAADLPTVVERKTGIPVTVKVLAAAAVLAAAVLTVAGVFSVLQSHSQSSTSGGAAEAAQGGDNAVAETAESLASQAGATDAAAEAAHVGDNAVAETAESPATQAGATDAAAEAAHVGDNAVAETAESPASQTGATDGAAEAAHVGDNAVAETAKSPPPQAGATDAAARPP